MRPAFARLGERWRKHVDPEWLRGWDPFPVELPGGATHVVSMGSGPTLVLIPPLPGYKEAWLAAAAPLARRFRVVTFDLRVRYTGAPRWEVLLDDLERVLDVVAPGQVAVLGHSLGGALAQRLAIARPERVRSLVLSSTFVRVTNPRTEWGRRFVEQPFAVATQRLLPRGLALPLARGLAAREAWVYDLACDERMLDFVRFCIRDLPIAAARECLRLAFAHDTRAGLSAISCPTLLILGEKDTALVHESAQELKRLLPHATLAVSPGVGHLHPLSGAPWLVETVTAWLSRGM